MGKSEDGGQCVFGHSCEVVGNTFHTASQNGRRKLHECFSFLRQDLELGSNQRPGAYAIYQVQGEGAPWLIGHLRTNSTGTAS